MTNRKTYSPPLSTPLPHSDLQPILTGSGTGGSSGTSSSDPLHKNNSEGDHKQLGKSHRFGSDDSDDIEPCWGNLWDD